MSYSNIDKGSKYFNTVTYTGTGSNLAVTGVGFKPDWVWCKSRSAAEDHTSWDAVRGSTKRLSQNTTGAEFVDATQGMQSFNTDGFTCGVSDQYNKSGQTQVSWCWLGANTTVSNTAGTITSTVSANTPAGFSIVSYTGNGTNGATIGHGLGVSPKMVIVKSRSNTGDWAVYHASLTAGNMVFLNTTGASGTISGFDNGGINPVSSTTFTTAQGGVSQNNVNTSGRTYIAYCFADVKGYSKFGSYTGNGASGNGTFTYLGFKPAFVMIKETSGIDGWGMFDNKRVPYNYVNTHVQAQSSSADITNTADAVDFLSNGFKVATGTSSANFINESGASYIYMAFAENPFVSSKGIPTTAR